MLEGYVFHFACAEEAGKDAADMGDGGIDWDIDEEETSRGARGGYLRGVGSQVEGMCRLLGIGGRRRDDEGKDCIFSYFRHLDLSVGHGLWRATLICWIGKHG